MVWASVDKKLYFDLVEFTFEIKIYILNKKCEQKLTNDFVYYIDFSLRSVELVL